MIGLYTIPKCLRSETRMKFMSNGRKKNQRVPPTRNASVLLVMQQASI